MAVGFAGLGRMGLPLALRLAASGLPVIVYNRTREKAEALVTQGIHWVATPRDLAKSIGKGITFVMLTDGKAVRTVLFGRGGFARAAPPGALVVDLSTIDPEESRANAAKLAERGIHYVDAAVGGSVDQVTDGTVAFFVGGDDPDVARVRPFLERMGRRAVHLGPVGSGTSAKLVNNLLTVGITTLSTEALALAEGLGLDRGKILDVLLNGGGRSSMLERKAPAFQSRQYPTQFSTILARKDLKLIEKAAAREGQSLRMTREARKLLDETIALGRGEEDFSAVLEATLTRAHPPGARKPSGSAVSPAPVEPSPTGGDLPGADHLEER
jgi:3-hydroxyisobutyrate dehydrogenase-like beta-hydroxyacid dehydrogenase